MESKNRYVFVNIYRFSQLFLQVSCAGHLCLCSCEGSTFPLLFSEIPTVPATSLWATGTSSTMKREAPL